MAEETPTPTEVLPVEESFSLSSQMSLLPEKGPDVKPSFFADTLPAAFRQENIVGSFVGRIADPFDGTIGDPNFDRFTELQGTKYEDHIKRFIYADTPNQVEEMKQQIDMEEMDRQTIQESGGMGVVAMLGAGIFDLPTLLPGGIAIKGLTSGKTLMSIRSAASVGAAGFVGASAAEAGLHATQELRTGTESAINITAGTVLSGILGAALPVAKSLMSGQGKSLDDLTRALESDLTNSHPGTVGDDIAPESAGAAATRTSTLEEEGLKGALGAEKLIAALPRAFNDPSIRLASSPLLTARRFVQDIAESVLTLKKNALGEATYESVEGRVKQWRANLGIAMGKVDDSFTKYRTGKAKSFGTIAKIGVQDLAGAAGREGKLTFKAFKEEVGKAMRSEDVHEIPEVAAAAKAMRDELFEPLKNRAIEVGLLDPDTTTTTAMSYFSRVYDIDSIIANRGEFHGNVHSWLKEERDAAGSRIRDQENEVLLAQEDIDGLRKEARRATGAAKTATKEASNERLKKERDVLAAQREARIAEREFKLQDERAEKFRPSELEAEDKAYYKELIGDLKRGHPKGGNPESITQWVRRIGGLEDFKGELVHIGISGKANTKLVKAEGGMKMDDAALRAWEEGFIGTPGGERPTIDEFISALSDDFNGHSKVIRGGDDALQARMDYLDDLREGLERHGVDLNKMDGTRLKNELDRLGGDDVEYRASTPAARARYREISFNRRRALKRVHDANARYDVADESLFKAKADVLDVKQRLRPEAARRLKSLQEQINSSVKIRKGAQDRLKTDKRRMDRDDEELSDLTDEIIDRIISTPDGRLPYDLDLNNPNKSGGRDSLAGPLKQRVFNIPDDRMDGTRGGTAFLENDVEVVSRMYERTVSADVEMYNKFGSVDLASQMGDIRREAAQKIAKATTEKERIALNKAKDSAIEDLGGIRDRIRGTYAVPKNPDAALIRTGRFVRNLNYLRLLGGMTLSAIPDLGRSVMVHGIMRTFKNGVVPLVKNFKALKMSAFEVKLSGTAWDMALDTRVQAMADIMEDYGRHSKIERGIQSLSQNFGIVSLMAPWNAAMKQFAGVVTQSRMIEAVLALRKGQINPKEAEKLLSQGLDQATSIQIADQFLKHGEEVDGVFIANTQAWDKSAKEAKLAYRSALSLEVDKIIVTPGQDKPLWMSTEWGKQIGQFKSFAFASTQRVLLSGLQQRDMAAFNGMMMSIGLGMVTYGLKEKDAGRETSDDPAKWVVEGVDRSGLISIFGDVNNVLEKVTRGRVGMNALINEAPMSRYASRNIMGALLGPSVGTLTSAQSIIGAASTGDWSKSDVSAFMRLMPYQNLMGVRQGFQKIRDGVAEQIGATE
jgi:hypothetical protein